MDLEDESKEKWNYFPDLLTRENYRLGSMSETGKLCVVMDKAIMKDVFGGK